MNIIGVIGSGTMGNGIAHVSALSGHKVILLDLNQKLLGLGLKKIKSNMERQIKKDNIIKDEMKLALSNIETTTNIGSLQRCDLIIEAATEDTEIKKNIFRSVNEISTKKTILASNTSSISIDLMASIIDHPENFIGMHFMNPVPIMRLVEIIKGGKTSKNTEYKIIKLAEKMGKIPVVCNDSPGFVANRILIPMINEAIFTYEEGVATVESIDKIMTLGMNHPMGPLKLADLIGLDVVLNICKILHKDFNDDKYRPSNLLVRMVNDGKLGFKTGNGFYKY